MSAGRDTGFDAELNTGLDAGSPSVDADRARRPSFALQLGEVRTGLDWAITSLSAAEVGRWPRGDGHTVLVVPGFLADAHSTGRLRSTLAGIGYRAEDWDLGRNLGMRPGVEDRLRRRVETLARDSGGSVSIVGWSLGGIFAREVARQVPYLVRGVITLGAPFRGNHNATRAWQVYAALNRRHLHLSPMDEAARVARAEPLTVPTTCIYSRRDGVVAWECCTSLPAPRTENVEVDSTHLGYRHHLGTLRVIADRLAQDEGTWAPYRGSA